MFFEKTRKRNIAKKKSGSEHCSCESGHCAQRANGRKNPRIRILVRKRVSKCFTPFHRVSPRCNRASAIWPVPRWHPWAP